LKAAVDPEKIWKEKKGGGITPAYPTVHTKDNSFTFNKRENKKRKGDSHSFFLMWHRARVATKSAQ